MSKLNRSTIEHFHFLLLEIQQQLEQTEVFFVKLDITLTARILGRGGYVENLRTQARRSLLSQLQRSLNSPLQFRLQAAEHLVAELFQFSQLGRQAISDCSRLKSDLLAELPHKECARIIKRMRLSLGSVEQALAEANSQVALEIDDERRKLSKKLTKMLNKAVLDLGEHQRLRDAADILFPIYALRQMIALMASIAESLLSANLGQRMNLSRFESLSDIADDVATTPDNLTLNTVAETRSGSAIAAISRKDQESDDPLAIFKEGEKSKVKEERESVQSWHDIYPGLAPKILSYHKRGDTASILIEHLPGVTFERVVTEQTELAQPALKELLKTLQNIWRETRSKQPAWAKHMTQLEKRLPAVFQIHPEFKLQKQHLCGEAALSLEALMEKAAAIEKRTPAPFSVYIHGDFNLDNIIYDPIEKRINFIDLHRSRYMDYVQDVAVFMVSIYRLKIVETQQRSAMLGIARQFLSSIRRFAKKEQDDSFEIRLTLGLIRSFITSTRFILDPTLSKRMFLRALYLLNHITSMKTDKLDKYRLPLEEIFFE